MNDFLPPPQTGKWSAMRQVMEGSKLLWKRSRQQQREETPALWTLKEQSCKVPSPLGCNQSRGAAMQSKTGFAQLEEVVGEDGAGF